MTISQLFESKDKTFSFEVFPTKTPESHARLLGTLKELCALKPDFISCTYGAGGSSRDKTFDVVEYIQKTFHVPSMAHLTCISHTKDEIRAIMQEFEKRQIRNILALRGDPPQDDPQAKPKGFQYSSELVAYIRSYFENAVSIGVAGFPEKHQLAPDAESDAQYLKKKIEAGADFVVTQLFFDNQLYVDYVKRLRKIGVQSRVIPGILPITDYHGLVRFCERCGASVPQEVHDIFKPIADQPTKVLEAGIDFAIQQCRDLLKKGAPGIHFYTLNKIHPVDTILRAVRGE